MSLWWHKVLDKQPVRVQRLVHRLQRMTVQVTLGMTLILGSHFLRDAEERAWGRDTGTAVVSLAFARWLAGQGKMRRDERGDLIRHPTVRISPEDAERIRQAIRR